MLVLNLNGPKTQNEFYGSHAFQLGIHFMDSEEHLENLFECEQLLNE